VIEVRKRFPVSRPLSPNHWVKGSGNWTRSGKKKKGWGKDRETVNGERNEEFRERGRGKGGVTIVVASGRREEGGASRS
jgi:hypothetical protein